VGGRVDLSLELASNIVGKTRPYSLAGIVYFIDNESDRTRGMLLTKLMLS
jgi:hypothetical protein